MLVAARRLSRDLRILVRDHDSTHAARLIEQGATQVVPEVLEAGLHLGQLMLQYVGLPTDSAREVVDAIRAAAPYAMAPRSGDERGRG